MNAADSLSTAHPLRRWMRRPRVWVTGLGLVAVIVYSIWILAPQKRELPLIAELKTPVSSSQYYYPWPLAFSPDGSLLAATKPGTGIVLWDLSTKTIRTELPLADFVIDAVFDRQGRRLAVSTLTLGPVVPRRFTIFDRTGRDDRVSFEVESQLILNQGFSDDGLTLSMLVWTGQRNTPVSNQWATQEWDVTTGKLKKTQPFAISEPLPPIWSHSPDLKTMVLNDGKESDVRIWDVAAGRVVGSLPVAVPSVSTVQYALIAPDGVSLIVWKSDGVLELWDLGSRKLQKTFHGHSPNLNPMRIQFSKDLNFMVSEGVEHVGKASVIRKAQYVLSWLTSRGKAEGSRMEALVWDLNTGKVRARLPEEGRATLSPDGKRLATISTDGLIRVHDLSPR